MVVRLIIIIQLGFMLPTISLAQRNKELVKDKWSANKVRNFYTADIPAALNGSDILPAIVSGIDLKFGDDQARFKYGGKIGSGNDPSNKFNHSYFLGLNLSAPDGVASLYQYDGVSTHVGLSAGATFILRKTNWYYKDENKKDGFGEKSSESINWINFAFSTGRQSNNIFSDDTTYSKVKVKPWSLMVRFNRYFHSELPSKRFLNSILSFGVGVGRIHNYESLDAIVLQPIQLYNLVPPGAYSVIKGDPVKGRLGNFVTGVRMLFSLEWYHAIARRELFNLYWGNRGFGYLGTTQSINASSGLFFSFSERDKTEIKEKFGFSINATLRNIQQREKDIWKDNFGISLSASVPLLFGLE